MMLSELVKICSDKLEKYGDREVLVDVEARSFNYHLVEISHAGMAVSKEDYVADPSLIADPILGMFIIGLK